MGRARQREKRRRRMAARQLDYLEDVAAMRRLPQWPDCESRAWRRPRTPQTLAEGQPPEAAVRPVSERRLGRGDDGTRLRSNHTGSHLFCTFLAKMASVHPK